MTQYCCLRRTLAHRAAATGQWPVHEMCHGRAPLSVVGYVRCWSRNTNIYVKERINAGSEKLIFLDRLCIVIYVRLTTYAFYIPQE